jgi:hypothetical protein
MSQRRVVSNVSTLTVTGMVSASGCGLALSEPMPAVSYSLSAQQRIQTWRQSLTGTPATPAR